MVIDLGDGIRYDDIMDQFTIDIHVVSIAEWIGSLFVEVDFAP